VNEAWLVVGGVTGALVAIKSGSVLLAARQTPHPRFMAVVEALAPALLAALVVAETFAGRSGGLSIDARLAGLAAATAAVAVRAPLIAIVAAAAAAAAAARAIA
jgi:branched chain amino acid efflux pump